uniref:Uncharacterized protein n=1 Tax=Sphaerodactylus townsendi TaxID=933632 RepID=A0ACB8FTZ7_9SAUR
MGKVSPKSYSLGLGSASESRSLACCSKGSGRNAAKMCAFVYACFAKKVAQAKHLNNEGCSRYHKVRARTAPGILFKMGYLESQVFTCTELPCQGFPVTWEHTYKHPHLWPYFYRLEATGLSGVPIHL